MDRERRRERERAKEKAKQLPFTPPETHQVRPTDAYPITASPRTFPRLSSSQLSKLSDWLAEDERAREGKPELLLWQLSVFAQTIPQTEGSTIRLTSTGRMDEWSLAAGLPVQLTNQVELPKTDQRIPKPLPARLWQAFALAPAGLSSLACCTADFSHLYLPPFLLIILSFQLNSQIKYKI